MTYLIPLKQQAKSEDCYDNFLFKENNIYVMDNHRLALWCWLQHLDLANQYNIFHIDAHPDMSESAIIDLNENCFKNISLDNYRNLAQKDFNIPLVRWDNYIKIFETCFQMNFNSENSISFTHHLGSTMGFKNDLESIFLLKEINSIMSGRKFINNNKWILNLDLDYFFSSQPEKILMYTDEYILNIAKAIKLGLQNDLIEVVTIAISPECCGSWENAIMAFNIINQEFNLKIQFN